MHCTIYILDQCQIICLREIKSVMVGERKGFVATERHV